MDMQILYFAYVNLDIANAVKTHTLGLLRGFGDNGCRVDAVVPRPSLPPSIPGVRFRYLKRHYGGRRFLIREVLRSTLRLLRLCRQSRYDAVYARDGDVFVGPRLCSRLFGIPLYLEIDDTPVERSYPALIRRAVLRNLAADYRRASGLIVPSVPRCRILEREFGVPAQKLHMILNGAEVRRQKAEERDVIRKRLGLPPGCFCVGYVGSVSERYDFDTVLEVMRDAADCPLDLRFLIVGDGTRFNEVRGRVQSFGLEGRVLFTGFVREEDFHRILPAMDIGLMMLKQSAVLTHGPIHTKLGTYGMYGLPVVASGYSLRGYPEGIGQGLFLLPPEEPPALRALLNRLGENPEQGRGMGVRLQEYVMKNMTWEAVARRIMGIMRGSPEKGVGP